MKFTSQEERDLWKDVVMQCLRMVHSEPTAIQIADSVLKSFKEKIGETNGS